MTSRRSSTKATPAQPRIAFVQSSWHKDLLLGCRAAFVETMVEHGYAKNRIEHFDVPGAFELPLHAQLLAQTGRYAAVVANGFVVDGGIYRHEFVAAAVIDGLMRVQLDTAVPVLSVVLTPHEFHEHDTHREFFREHLKIKGVEAAHACVQTLRSLRKLSGIR